MTAGRKREAILSPDVARVKAAIVHCADELRDESAQHGEGTFAKLISNRISKEFAKLAEELHFH
jgi:hypothetical protein